MSKLTIITDAVSDMPKELASKLKVKVIPMSFLIDEIEYFEGADDCIPLSDFYYAMQNGKTTHTSQITIEVYRETFEAELKAGNDVLYIGVSSGCSGSFDKAMVARGEIEKVYPNNKIYLVDSLTASMGESLMVYKAAEMLKDGKTADEIYQWLEDNKQRVCSVFTVDTLKFLQRSGRVSKAAAFAASILQIKPVLHVNSKGELTPFAKKMGRRASIEAVIAQMVKTASPDYKDVIMISHANCIEEAKLIGEKLKSKFMHIKEVIYSFVGTIVGSLGGPGSLALFYFAENRNV